MSKLYLVPTPIGNLEDITLRAIRILKEVDLVLAEDTRQTGKLMRQFEIDSPLKSFHQHNEHDILEKIITEIQSGITIALVSDAGSPGISDPGFLLVRECVKNNISVESLPGPTALIPALTNSGIPCDRFCFEGFLPVKKGRQSRLASLANERRTLIFYESPHRLLKTLKDLSEYMGEDRQACVCRELTKIHEETFRGRLNEIYNHFESRKVKGEIVIVVQGQEKK